MKTGLISCLIVVGLFFVLLFLVSPIVVSSEKVIVTKIIDGDTIIVQGGETIRLLGMDCDERGKPCYTPAKKRIEEILLNNKVSLEMATEDKDLYGRSLRYIFLEGVNVNEQMVEEGLCVARFPEDIKYKKDIVEAESFAIKNSVGCKWSEI